MKRIIALAIALLLAGSTSALAHGSGSRILGTVTAVTADTITVRAEDGDMVSVTVNAATRYLRGTDEVALSDVVVGARIAIEVESEPGSTTAKAVRLAAAPGAAQSTGPNTNENACDHAGNGTGQTSCGRASTTAREQDGHDYAH
ncbi:MAG: hypothetical protein HY899_18715 [Deltaproteobacteria bacterium]|nr:hypothetical protein [Deltaproteobacteria bacterium]